MDGKKMFSYFDVVFPRSGLLDGTKRVQELFSMHTKAQNFEDLNIPMAMVATDLHRGKKVVLRSGSLIEGLRATMSYPGLFAPVRRQGRWLVDGGVVDPVPVGLARAMGAEVVIAVDLNSRLVSRSKPTAASMGDSNARQHPFESTAATGGGRHELMKRMTDYYENVEKTLRSRTNQFLQRELATPDIIETVMTSVSIMQERITRINLAVDQPDILIQPRLGQLKMMNFDQVEHTIKEGYIGLREKLEDIQILLDFSS
jgi:NTE family protein